MSSSMGRSADALNRDLSAANRQIKDLREAVARAAKQHEDDMARIQRLEARSSLDSSAAKIAQLEQRNKALLDERQSLRVQLEAAAETEAALRDELAVRDQMAQWEEFPELRASAITTVRAEAFRARAENAEGRLDVEARRVAELTDEIRECAAEREEMQAALDVAYSEIDRLNHEAQQGREALAENNDLRQALADGEAELETLREEVSVLRPRLAEVEQESAQHRASWKSSRDYGAERDAAARQAQTALEALQQAHAKATADLLDAQRDIECNVLEIAALRKREAQWEDEHGMLNDERAEVERLRHLVDVQAQQLQHAEELRQALEQQRDSDARSIDDYRTRLTNTETALASLRIECKDLHEEFASLERQAGRQALELEQYCAAASAEAGSLRLKSQTLEKENQLLKAKVSALKLEAVSSVNRMTKAASELLSNATSQSPPTSKGNTFGSAPYATAVGASIPEPPQEARRATSSSDSKLEQERFAESASAGFSLDATRFASRPGLRRMHRRDFAGTNVSPTRSALEQQQQDYQLSPQTPLMR